MKFVCGSCGREWKSEGKEGRCENCGARVVARGVDVNALPGKGLRIIVLVGIVVVLAVAAVGLYTVVKMPSETSKQEQLVEDVLDALVVAVDEYRLENEGEAPVSLSVLGAEGALPEGAKVDSDGRMMVGKYRISYFLKDGDFIFFAEPTIQKLRYFLATDRVYVVDAASVKMRPLNYDEAYALLGSAKAVEE